MTNILLCLVITYLLSFVLATGFIIDTWTTEDKIKRKARLTLFGISCFILSPLIIPILIVGIFIWLIIKACEKEEGNEK